MCIVAENEMKSPFKREESCDSDGLVLTRLVYAYRCGPQMPALPTAPPLTCCGSLRHRGAQETTW